MHKFARSLLPICSRIRPASSKQNISISAVLPAQSERLTERKSTATPSKATGLPRFPSISSNEELLREIAIRRGSGRATERVRRQRGAAADGVSADLTVLRGRAPAKSSLINRSGMQARRRAAFTAGRTRTKAGAAPFRPGIFASLIAGGASPPGYTSTPAQFRPGI